MPALDYQFIGAIALFFVAVWLLTRVVNARILRSLIHTRPSLTPAPREQAPLYLRERAEADAPRFEPLGFENDGAFLSTGPRLLDPHYYWQWRHPDAGTLAHLWIDAGDGTGVPNWVFQTLLADGTWIVTTNELGPYTGLTTPGCLVEIVEREAVEKLWERHVARVQAQADAQHALPAPLDAATAAAALDAGFERTWQTMQAATEIYEANGPDSLRFRWSWIFRQGLPRLLATVARQKELAKARAARAAPPLPVYSPEAAIDLEVRAAQLQDTGRKARRLTPRGRLAVSAISLLLFAVVMLWRGDLTFALLLTGALLFHELGHLVTMRIFGSRDTSMVFIPLFGGAAIQNDRPLIQPWQEVLILLAGPLPGLVLGILLGGCLMTLPHGSVPPWLDTLVLILISLNVFNLLPIMPLDGGQLLQVALLSRFPRLGVLFKAVSGLALVVVGFYLTSSTFLGIMGGLALLRLPLEWKLAAAHRDLRAAARKDGFASPEEEPWLRRVFQRLRSETFSAAQAPQKGAEAIRLAHLVRQPLAGWGTVLLAFIGWLSPLWVPLAAWPGFRAFGDRALVEVRAEAEAAGIPSAAAAERRLRAEAARIPPEQDAQKDYAAACALVREPQATVMTAAEASNRAWKHLQAGAQKPFWTEPPPAKGSAGRPGPGESDEATAASWESPELLVGVRLRRELEKGNASHAAEALQVALRLQRQRRETPRPSAAFSSSHLPPGGLLVVFSDLEEGLRLRMNTGRPITPEGAALLAAALPPRSELEMLVIPTYLASVPAAVQAAAQPYPEIDREDAGPTPWFLQPLAFFLRNSPTVPREQAEILRHALRVQKAAKVPGDPWLKRLDRGERELDEALPEARSRWTDHRTQWARVIVRLEMARAALAWHAAQRENGPVPANWADFRAPWFEGVAPKDPLRNVDLVYQARTTRDGAEFLLESNFSPALEKDVSTRLAASPQLQEFYRETGRLRWTLRGKTLLQQRAEEAAKKMK